MQIINGFIILTPILWFSKIDNLKIKLKDTNSTPQLYNSLIFNYGASHRALAQRKSGLGYGSLVLGYFDACCSFVLMLKAIE
ncbi:MAG: hypothetical protein WBO26_18045 [Providencia rettgeri]